MHDADSACHTRVIQHNDAQWSFADESCPMGHSDGQAGILLGSRTFSVSPHPATFRANPVVRDTAPLKHPLHLHCPNRSSSHSSRSGHTACHFLYFRNSSTSPLRLGDWYQRLVISHHELPRDPACGRDQANPCSKTIRKPLVGLTLAAPVVEYSAASAVRTYALRSSLSPLAVGAKGGVRRVNAARRSSCAKCLRSLGHNELSQITRGGNFDVYVLPWCTLPIFLHMYGDREKVSHCSNLVLSLNCSVASFSLHLTFLRAPLPLVDS